MAKPIGLHREKVLTAAQKIRAIKTDFEEYNTKNKAFGEQNEMLTKGTAANELKQCSASITDYQQAIIKLFEATAGYLEKIENEFEKVDTMMSHNS